MCKSTTLPLVLFALLLAACNLQTTTVEPPTPTLPTALPVVVLVTQPSVLPIQTVLPSPQSAISLPTIPASGGLLYLWPVSFSPEMKFNGARSSSSDGGYMIEFDNAQTGSSIVLQAGTEADRYPYCAGGTIPYQIRSVEGCYSHGTGAGTSLEWRENGIHYSVGGMGNSLESVVQFANNLQVLDYQTWQQKFANATNVPPADGGLLYLWPVSFSSEMKFNGARSSSSDSGYMIEFDNAQTGSALDLRAGTEADRYPYCAENTNPYQIRNVKGCYSMGTGAGAALAWRENGIHYSVGGIGNNLEAAIQFTNSLEALNYQTWQQKFSNAANVPPAYTRIEFITGTTSNTTAYRKLASGKFDEYMLGAMAGQELTVNIVPYTFTDSENFVLTISGMDGSVLVSEAAQVHLWTGILPATQDYVIRVTNQGNTAQYQLNVNIPWRIKLTAGATSTTLNGKLVTGNSVNEYLLQAKAGQTLSVSTMSTNNNACLSITARMTDGSSIPLINAASQPMTSYSTVLPTETGYSQDYSISVSSCPNAPAGDSLYTLLVNVAN